MLLRLFCLVLCLANTPTQAATTAPGDILVGQSAAQTGFFAPYATAIQTGIQACFEQVNAQGGIQGKKIRLTSLDDRGNAPKTAENIATLHRTNNINLFMGIMGTKGIAQQLDLFKQKRALALFPWGDSAAFAATDYIIPGFPSVNDQLEALMTYCSDTLGIDRLGLFHGDDQFSTIAADYAQQKAHKHRAVLAGRAAYNRLTLSIASSMAPLLEQNPKAVLCIATSAPTAYGIDHLMTQGHFGTQFLSIDSGLFVPQLLAQRGVPVHLASLVPDYTISTIAMLKDYLEAMRMYCPQQKPTILSCAYYIAARILVQALRSCKDPADLASVYEALTNSKQQSLGGFTTTYDSVTKRFWRQVWVLPNRRSMGS